MRKVLSQHRVFAVYCVSLLWLTMAALGHGLWNGRGPGHAPFLAGLLLTTLVAYLALWGLTDRLAPRATAWTREPPRQDTPLKPWQRRLLWGLALLLAAIFAGHLLRLGQIPLLAALTAPDDETTTLIRQQAYLDLPRWQRYLSDYGIKALAPALLLISAFYRQRVFWFVLGIACLYAVAMFARILPVILLLPLLVYLLLQRRWLALALSAALLGGLLAISTAASAPSIRASFGAVLAPVASANAAPAATDSANATPPDLMQRLRHDSVLYAVAKRALYIPGQVIDQWFAFYADPQAREGGCGYRLMARALGCPYVSVPAKLYQVYYPENVRNGMKGNLNAASFMLDYANFGPLGAMLGAVLAAWLFCLITLIYRDHPLAVPMNLPLVLASMETSLLTALNSGAGWLAMTALFLLFFRTPK